MLFVPSSRKSALPDFFPTILSHANNDDVYSESGITDLVIRMRHNVVLRSTIVACQSRQFDLNCNSVLRFCRCVFGGVRSQRAGLDWTEPHRPASNCLGGKPDDFFPVSTPGPNFEDVFSHSNPTSFDRTGQLRYQSSTSA